MEVEAEEELGVKVVVEVEEGVGVDSATALGAHKTVHLEPLAAAIGTKMKSAHPSQTSPREGIEKGIRGMFRRYSRGIRGYLGVFAGIRVLCTQLHTFIPASPLMYTFNMFP